MKKFIFLLAALAALTACDPADKLTKTYEVSVNMSLNGEKVTDQDIKVEVTDKSSAMVYEALTDAEGTAKFNLPSGIYSASTSYSVTEGTTRHNINGSASFTITEGSEKVIINVQESTSSQLLIKELYFGGCQKDDGSGVYKTDAYVILYNNGDTEIDASNVCLAALTPGNAHATNKYMSNGVLSYQSQGYIPAGYAIWWFDTEVKIAPYSQIVISIFGAIDHSATYSNSVNLSNADYVCYDPESGFNKANNYPAPSGTIHTSHYMKTYRYSLGTAWVLSTSSPAFCIIEYSDIQNYVKSVDNYDYTPGAKLPDVKVKNEWVVDAVEVFDANNIAKSNKRFPAAIDNGYVSFTGDQGYTVYRNVDKAATEAIQDNKGKLVYSSDADPSKIDAEASIAAGARIIFKDSNNSGSDFHVRPTSSLK